MISYIINLYTEFIIQSIFIMFQIFLSTLTNKTIIINDQSINSTTSIQQLRKFIAKKQNIPDPNIIRLIFAGKQLQNTLQNKILTMSDYSIINQSSLVMALRLSGGGNQIYSCISNKAENRASEPKMIKLIPKLVIQQILIQIEYLNSSYKLTVNQNWTVFQLKQKIYQMCHKSLEAITMKLSFAGVKLRNQKLLSTYKLKSGNKIIQSKLDLNQVNGLIVVYELDKITEETMTVRMPCGHVIGRDCMTSILKNLLYKNYYKIRCPFQKANGQLCQYEWDYPLCRKVGVLTKGLSEIWIRSFCVQCPQCHNKVQQDQKSKQNNEKKIHCPYTTCKNNKQYFCQGCLKKWNSDNKLYCGNQECKSGNNMLSNTQSKPFRLNDKGVWKDYLVPKFRRCPNCNMIIEHKDGCKHMTCKCMTKFCFVCLKLRGKQGYSCGNSSDYCGQIAGRQKL